MKTSFTPGKWGVCNCTDVFTQNGATNANGIKCDDNDGWLIADCAVGITMIDGEDHQLKHNEQMANARLIAASPALLESLIECYKSLLSHYTDGHIYTLDAKRLDDARAAINLATGQKL